MRIPGFTATAALSTERHHYAGSPTAAGGVAVAFAIGNWLLPSCPLGAWPCWQPWQNKWGCCAFVTHTVNHV
jgi:hypothetical protein